MICIFGFYKLIMLKNTPKVFYAVGVGHKVGVYRTWNECKKQIDGISNPKFRKFGTLQEAEEFVSKWQSKSEDNSGFPTTSNQLPRGHDLKKNDGSQEQQFRQQLKGESEPIAYNEASHHNDREKTTESGNAIDVAFLKDRVKNCERKVDICVGKINEILSGLTDIKNELSQLKMLIPGNFPVLSKEKDSGGTDGMATWAGRFSRIFALKCDAEESDETQKTRKGSSQTSKSESTSRSGDADIQEPPVKKKRIWDDRASSSSEESRMEKEIKKECSKHLSFMTDDDDYVVVYTDGSCVRNGSENAKAGIGIWFDDGHPLNVSRPLSGTDPTNNNAEIQAARIACDLAHSAGITKLKICTDSEFLINCVTKWVHRWKANGWSTGAKKPVKNRAELEKLLEVASRLSVRWEKVAGHSNIKGNEMADRLANDGAAYYVKH